MQDFTVFEAMNKLKLPDTEHNLISDRANAIFDSFGALNNIDTSGTEPLVTVLDTQNIFREDVCTKEITREELLASAPDHDCGYFRVPKTLEG